MVVCDCYFEQEVMDIYLYDRRLVGRCNGTKERDVCCCKGNRANCDFYPEVRKNANKFNALQTLNSYLDTNEFCGVVIIPKEELQGLIKEVKDEL